MARNRTEIVSLKLLASLAGVSKSSVSRCLSGKCGVSEQTSFKIREIAKKLGYTKNIPLSKAMSQIRSGGMRGSETIAFVNAKPVRDLKAYSAVSRYVAAARKSAEKYGYCVCDIWLCEKNFTAQKFENLLFTRGIRGGIIFGHYYKNSIPDGFCSAVKKLKFVSMGVNSNAPVKGSIFMDRFLLVKGFVKKIFKLGFDRVGFVIEKFADKYEDGKFSGGFLSAQLERGKRNIIPPHYWGKSDLKNAEGLSAYVRRHRLDALFCYSTDISDIISKNPPIGAKIFHYDERFAEKHTPRISNQKQVGKEAVKMLSEILSSHGGEICSPKQLSLTPEWSRKNS